MNFKAYDILSTLVPGFLALLAGMKFLSFSYDKDQIVAYTAVAFLLGYLMNTISSWMEDIYYFTLGGKPSSNLLKGKGTWKVKVYDSQKIRQQLLSESGKSNASEEYLFSLAMRKANGNKDSRVDDFNANYAFSRVLLTTIIVGSIFLLIQNYRDWRYFAACIPVTIIIWLRCKQRAYYYAKEVLNEYMKRP